MSYGRSASIVGDGISAASAAVTLLKFGWFVRFTGSSPREPRPIVISGHCQQILERMWGPDWSAGLPLHRLAQRTMLWSGGVTRRIDAATIVVDGAALADVMAARARAAAGALPDYGEVSTAWTITAQDESAPHHTFLTGGTRCVIAIPTACSSRADTENLMIEATGRGWLALVPTGPASATLFVFGTRIAGTQDDIVRDLVDQSRMVRRSITAITGPGRVSRAAPRFRYPPYGDEASFYVGTAAIALDPLSGDGMLAGLRTAHLAASLAEACAGGVALDEVRRFYMSRLARVMDVHLKALVELYCQAPLARNWSSEIDAMRRAREAIAARADAHAQSFIISELGAKATGLRYRPPSVPAA